MKVLLESHNLLFAMAALTAVAILLKCICAIIYHNLLHDARQIQTTKNKWIRAMVTKFEACYKIKIAIYNPDCFITQHLERYQICKISLTSLEHADVLVATLLLCMSLLTVIGGINYEMAAKWIALQSITFLFFISLLLLSEFLFKTRQKRQLLKLYLLDYFENTLQSKLENQYLHPEQQEAYQNAYFDVIATSDESTSEPKEKSAKENHSTNKKIKEKDKSRQKINHEMRELLDSLLQEEQLANDIKKIQGEIPASAATTEKLQLIEEIIKEYL